MATAWKRFPARRGIWIRRAPVELLRKISIVDTPGTNAIMREHEALTAEFIPRSDLVLFITSADRPFTESERNFLTQIKEWGKKIVLVVNKIDILNSDARCTESNRLRERGRAAADGQCSRRLCRIRAAGAAGRWRGRLCAVGTYIQDTLDDDGRFRLKLLNPLGVGSKLLQRELAAYPGRPRRPDGRQSAAGRYPAPDALLQRRYAAQFPGAPGRDRQPALRNGKARQRFLRRPHAPGAHSRPAAFQAVGSLISKKKLWLIRRNRSSAASASLSIGWWSRTCASGRPFPIT